MRIVIFMGSPRLSGNTAELCKPFMNTLVDEGAEVRYIPLAQHRLLPCLGCYACQNVQDQYGCPQQDDMEQMVSHIYWADCIVLATPIYSWYCPVPMKAFLDRHYGLNKFYGSASGSLWKGKHMALLMTHGYPAAYATDPFVSGIKRLCAHSGLIYDGAYSVRDEDNIHSFQTDKAIWGAQEFARKLIRNL